MDGRKKMAMEYEKVLIEKLGEHGATRVFEFLQYEEPQMVSLLAFPIFLEFLGLIRSDLKPSIYLTDEGYLELVLFRESERIEIEFNDKNIKCYGYDFMTTVSNGPMKVEVEPTEFEHPQELVKHLDEKAHAKFSLGSMQSQDCNLNRASRDRRDPPRPPETDGYDQTTPNSSKRLNHDP